MNVSDCAACVTENIIAIILIQLFGIVMKLIILLIFHLFVSSLIIFETGEGSVNYGSLMEKVYDEYKMYSIIIATTNDLSFEKMTTLEIILKEMSAKGIAVVIVKFMRLEETAKFHHRPSARLLVVIFIEKFTEIQEFKKGIANMDMSYPLWLLLFTGDEHEDSCKYCRDPIGNPFNTEMLISCCNMSSIVKWGSKMTNDSSTWSRDQKIAKFSEIGRHSYRPPSGHSFPINRKLRIVIPEEAEDVWRNGNRLYGYLGEIVMELSRVMNLSISRVWEQRFGVPRSESSSWAGAINTVARGEADIGAASFIVDSNGLRVVDFSSPLMRGEYTLFIALSARSSIPWNEFFEVFHPSIWMIIVTVLLITPLLLIIMDYKKNCDLYDTVSLHYLNVWGLFCQQSWSSHLMTTSSKILYLSLFISTLVINASYSAGLIRHLTTSPEYVQFRTIQEFVDDGTYEVIVSRDSPMHNWIKENNDTLLKKLKSIMKRSNLLPTTDAEGLKQLCTERVAFLGETTEGKFSWEVPSCEYVSFNLVKRDTAIIFPLKSEYTRIANYHIQRFRENGMLNRLKFKYFAKSNRTDLNYESVSFEDIVPVLTILAIGCLIALIILWYEKR